MTQQHQQQRAHIYYINQQAGGAAPTVSFVSQKERRKNIENCVTKSIFDDALTRIARLFATSIHRQTSSDC